MNKTGPIENATKNEEELIFFSSSFFENPSEALSATISSFGEQYSSFMTPEVTRDIFSPTTFDLSPKSPAAGLNESFGNDIDSPSSLTSSPAKSSFNPFNLSTDPSEPPERTEPTRAFSFGWQTEAGSISSYSTSQVAREISLLPSPVRSAPGQSTHMQASICVPSQAIANESQQCHDPNCAGFQSLATMNRAASAWQSVYSDSAYSGSAAGTSVSNPYLPVNVQRKAPRGQKGLANSEEAIKSDTREEAAANAAFQEYNSRRSLSLTSSNKNPTSGTPPSNKKRKINEFMVDVPKLWDSVSADQTGPKNGSEKSSLQGSQPSAFATSLPGGLDIDASIKEIVNDAINEKNSREKNYYPPAANNDALFNAVKEALRFNSARLSHLKFRTFYKDFKLGKNKFSSLMHSVRVSIEQKNLLSALHHSYALQQLSSLKSRFSDEEEMGVFKETVDAITAEANQVSAKFYPTVDNLVLEALKKGIDEKKQAGEIYDEFVIRHEIQNSIQFKKFLLLFYDVKSKWKD